MLFNSFEFLLFFPTVVILYFLLPYKYRWVMLLLASYFFYMCWKVEFIALIIISTLIDYYCGLKMSAIEEKKKRKPFLYLSLLTNLGLLFTFKYLDFSINSVNTVLGIDIPYANLILPMGISFYTFQTLSYSIDVYQGKLKSESHLGKFALYVSFFPQLVAGPIERATKLIPQLQKNDNDFDYNRVTSGLRLIAWGLIKKVIIADRLALFVNEVYNNSESYTGIPLILATVFFAFQIYCDFSGYSDIAIGCARVMGYDFMKNFNNPYGATSISDFWRKWHISLSTWFKDYVYIPLGGNKVVKWRMYYNFLIVFLLSGIWHGASWNFAIWGLLHVTYIILSIILTPLRSNIKSTLGIKNDNTWFLNLIRTSWVFVLVTIAWVFFRAEDLNTAIYILSNIHVNVLEQIKCIINNQNFARDSLLYLKQTSIQFALAVLSIIGLIIIQSLCRKREVEDSVSQLNPVIRWTIYYIAILFTLAFGVFGDEQFVYFQF